MKKKKRCVICDTHKNEDGSEPIGHCRRCGSPVCSFCEHLGACCDMAEDTEDDE